MKKESVKVDLKLNIQKTKVMASDPITLLQIDGETMKTMTYFIFWAPKSLQMVNEMKRCLLLGRNAMTNLDRLLKSRNITLLTKVHLVKAMVFPVVRHGCVSRVQLFATP